MTDPVRRAGEDDRPGISERLAGLSATQRALLERRLMESRKDVARRNIIAPREGDGPAPLSYAQELLWLLSQVFDDGIAYNAPGAFQLQGPLDLELLRRALEGLEERHSILRTTYKVVGQAPVQVIGSAPPVEINLIDLRGRPADDQQAESQRILKEESRFRFDLVNGPVMRTTVIRLADDEHILMLNMHHIATDGYSRSALYRDLTLLYDAFADGLPSPLPPLQIQYADYAVWQRRWLDQGIADAQLEYWKTKLARAPSRLDLPTDFPRPPVRSWVGDNMSLMLDMATRETLRATARLGDATLFVALLAAFGTFLGRYAGQDDIVVGTPFAGRNRTELESMVGYFINPLALRLDLSGDPTFTELVTRTRETTLAAFAHADVPYETVVREINPERDLSQTPVFQAMMVLHNPAWQTERPKFEPAWHPLRGDHPREGLGEVRPPARHERAHDRPEHHVGVQHRAVHPGHGRAHDRALPSAGGKRRQQPRSPPLAAVDALGVRAGQGAGVLELASRTAPAAGVRQGAVRGAGGADPGRHGCRLRG